MTNKSQILDVNSPTANMYGCEPCPQCGSEFRASYRRKNEAGWEERSSIECDDCGHTEEGIKKETQ